MLLDELRVDNVYTSRYEAVMLSHKAFFCAAITVIFTPACSDRGLSHSDDQTDCDAAYILSEVTPKSEAHYRQYLQEVSPLIRQFGGQVEVAPASRKEVIEGRQLAGQMTLLKFPSREDRDAFWNSPEYQPIKRKRLESADSRIIFLDQRARLGSHSAQTKEQ